MFMRVQARSRRPGDQDPMGEIQKRPFQLSFNASLRVDFQGSRVTSDGGLILVRELDERLGFGGLAAECLTDTRAKNAQLPIADLLAIVGREPSDAVVWRQLLFPANQTHIPVLLFDFPPPLSLLSSGCGWRGGGGARRGRRGGPASN